jgi:hypothetical protein
MNEKQIFLSTVHLWHVKTKDNKTSDKVTSEEII